MVKKIRWNNAASHTFDETTIYLQKEILQIASGKVKVKDVQLAMRSFALKSKYPVGMT